MDFTFSEDQLLFRDTVRDFLRKEVNPDRVRAGWEREVGRDAELWRQLADLGLTAITVPEAQGGLGMGAVDFVLIAEECGYVALPEPLVHTALVAVPLLSRRGGGLAEEWLPRVAAGEATVVVGPAQNLTVEHADVADLLVLQRGPELLAVAPGVCELQRNQSVDPSRRLFSVSAPADAPVLASGDEAATLLAEAMTGGALGCAAQALGLAQRMLDMSVAYTAERRQFGVPVGSFQAVKHHLANVAVRLEYARAPVYRAACCVATGQARAGRAASHAKLAACEAASLAARHGIQVHGAMGYTWEVDLHIFMKRAWALANSWGDAGFHKQRIAEHIFAPGAELGATATFA